MWIADMRGPNIPYPPPNAAAPASTNNEPLKKMEKTFIEALIKASSCRQGHQSNYTRPSLSSTRFTYHRTRRRFFCTGTERSQSIPVSQSRPNYDVVNTSTSIDEYIQLLDYYHLTSEKEPPPIDCTPQIQKEAVQVDRLGSLPDFTTDEIEGSDGKSQATEEAGNLTQSVISDTKDDELEKVNSIGRIEDSRISAQPTGENTKANLWADPAREPQNERERQAINDLLTVLQNPSSNSESIFEAYTHLPWPGVSYLNGQNRSRLLSRLGDVHIKSRSREQLRYLSVAEEMRAASLPLNEAHWNTVIAFTGRCYARIQATGVASALISWRDMEQEVGVESGIVTFNILFDIATKAGKFGLAEKILKEMEVRNLPPNRYSQAAMIYYKGLKGNGNGVRRAYREFVEAGHIVDTVIMNCVIASLIRAGEVSAAEQTFERMKRLVHNKTGVRIPLYDWRDVKDLGRMLNRAADIFRHDPERLQRLQRDQVLAPDLTTYSIFLQYHVSQSGELRRVAELLGEMAYLNVPIQGGVFRKLFEGFARHGGVRYTAWTSGRLESVYRALLAALDEGLRDVAVMKWMVLWAVRAFGRCCGQKRTLEVWKELGSRWQIEDEGDRATVERVLRSTLRRESKDEDL
ncbi:MAG: hypothetical protein LQ351_004810 [Letrouitia transgressa]|nr:MAG: hypothetical protein LQ351_004810 [Letrouitia transgressa]